MATVIETPTVDDVEDALIQLDRDYCTVYGPNLADWSKGVRGEFLEQLRTRRTMDRETHPLHPRRSSAGRRRRHRTQLAWRIHQIAPDAVTVLLAPYWSDATGEVHRVFIAQCFDVNGERISLPRGGSSRLASLLQGAYPASNWDQAQSWRADTNQLTTWQQRRRAS